MSRGEFQLRMGLTRAVIGSINARLGLWACVCAFCVYSALGLIAHQTLRTNAFDLSVFDYALWTTAWGDPLGYVPMFRYSLFAQHFMPTLLLLAPLSRLFDSPAYLIVLVLPSSSVGEMTLRLYGALSYSQNSARDLRCALNRA